MIVKDTVTTNGKKSTGLMYIAAKGPALVYKIVDDTPGDVSTVVFQHYGPGVTLTVPPNAINLTGLKTINNPVGNKPLAIQGVSGFSGSDRPPPQLKLGRSAT